MRKMMIICLLLATSLTAYAEDRTLRELFVEMPDSLLPYLSRNNRLDFIDFIDSGMKAEVTNSLDGKSQMLSLSDDSLLIQMNEACRIAIYLMKPLLPIDSCSQIIVLVRSIGFQKDVINTEVDYFGLDWQRLSKKPKLIPVDEKRLSSMCSESNVINMLQKRLINIKK